MGTTVALFSCLNVDTIQWAIALDKHKMRTYVLERLRNTLFAFGCCLLLYSTQHTTYSELSSQFDGIILLFILLPVVPFKNLTLFKVSFPDCVGDCSQFQTFTS
jgi:hypothetical protein